MSDNIRVPFPILVPGLGPYEARKSLPERLAIDWFHEPCSEFVHPHMEHACSRYGLEIGTDSFRAALSIYGPLYMVTTLLTKPNPVELLRRAIPAIFRSSIFFGVFTCLYARFACFLMQLCGNRNFRFIFWLSPFLMSLVAVNIEKATRRRELAVYMANQTAETVFKMLLSRGYFTYTPFRTGKRALFAASVALLHLFYHWSPKDLAPSVHSLLRVLAGTKCQNSAADWIEKRVRIVTHPFLQLTKSKNTPNLVTGSENGGEQSEDLSKQKPLNGGDVTGEVTSGPNEFTGHESHNGLKDQEYIITIEHRDAEAAPTTAPEPTLPDAIENYVSTYSNSRIMFTINGFVRGFLIGYVVRALLAFGPTLFNPAVFIKNAGRIMSKSFGKNAFDFGLFVSLMVGIPRLVKVLLTKVFGREHPIIDSLAGLLGGAAGSMLHASTEVTLYIGSKATEALVQHGVRKGSLEPWTVRPSYRKFLAKGSGWHYGRFSESDGVRGLRESTGLNQLRSQYIKYKKES